MIWIFRIFFGIFTRFITLAWRFSSLVQPQQRFTSWNSKNHTAWRTIKNVFFKWNTFCFGEIWQRKRKAKFTPLKFDFHLWGFLQYFLFDHSMRDFGLRLEYCFHSFWNCLGIFNLPWVCNYYSSSCYGPTIRKGA